MLKVHSVWCYSFSSIISSLEIGMVDDKSLCYVATIHTSETKIL